MKGKRHTTEEKIRILREADGGKSIVELCRELPVLGLERPAKLLVSPFQQSVITTARFQAIKVLRHTMHHQFPSSLSLRKSFGFHARKHAVTTSGDNFG